MRRDERERIDATERRGWQGKRVQRRRYRCRIATALRRCQAEDTKADRAAKARTINIRGLLAVPIRENVMGPRTYPRPPHQAMTSSSFDDDGSPAASVVGDATGAVKAAEKCRRAGSTASIAAIGHGAGPK